jgi:hypothetical protein
MLTMSKFVLPYEPQFTAHREAEKRHQDVKDWLRGRDDKEPAPSIVPEHSAGRSVLDQSKRSNTSEHR